ncbi:MAG: MBL fold metallo-hydrolase [Actinomycetales bacterium]|nr:MBL fold metallo-hydrolase [Tetrasphaera sp.]NLW98678.1 MBL fold metallo-hydrolase [Actinomycetales bacterium]
MADFTEIADRVWTARYAWVDLTVTAVGGERGLVVIDTHGSTAAGRAVVEDVRRIGAGEVTAVVNTHWHWDHSFGNAAFREQWPHLPIHAQENAALWLRDHAAEVQNDLDDGMDPERAEEIRASTIVIPDRLFGTTAVIDLGDRAVELIHPGRGHTDGDLVARVPDANVLVAGDLIEESAHPWIGDDSWPLEWASTLEALLPLIAPGTVVVPGHGALVDRAFVEGQRGEMAAIEREIRRLAAAGISEQDAVAEGDWPWEATNPGLANAVSRGYAQLT